MKYVRYQTSVAKIFDGTITDHDDIKQILSSIKDRELTCKLRLTSGPKHDYVRILDVKDDVFRWRMVKNKAILRDESSFDDILELEVNSDMETVLHLKPKPSRWTLLDPAADLDDV